MSKQDESQQQKSAMDELRELLFQQESARIDRLEELLTNPSVHAKEVAAILAEAVRLRSQQDGKLGEALRPAVESAITASITKNPKPLSDALFPVMGPAIRKAINHAIASMMQSLNQTLEHSFSMKGLQWRLDAIKTGKPFAEIVMLNTLVYRVEQVFLIHKETGLLLKHLSFDSADNEDADVVSSMLTAVRDFIQDSFAASSDQETQSLRLGDLEVMIEQGPETVLAVVCRGTPPQSLYTNMNIAIEDIQHEFRQALQNFDGDTSIFDSAEDTLSALMLSDYGAKQEQESSPAKILIPAGIICLALLTWWGWNTYQDNVQQAHWQRYIDTLRHQPGIVLTHVSKADGIYTLSGMRDPLSVDPETLLSDFQLDPEHVHYVFQPYHALQPSLVLKRATKLLQPPESVQLSFDKDTLHISGTAPKSWIKHAREKALWIAGISHIDTTALKPIIPLMEQVKSLIHPPESIHMQRSGTKLILSGKTTEQWLAQAKEKIKHFKAIQSYDDSQVVRVDANDYLLTIAKQRLHPTASVQLTVTGDKVLHAKGKAPKWWIQQAKHKAANIDYIKAFDISQLNILQKVKPNVLELARATLTPPSSVMLAFSNGVLTASGTAPKAWIKRAKTNAPLIHGVTHFDTEHLQVELSLWQQYNKQVQSIQLSSQTKKPVLNTDNKKTIKTLADIFKRSLSLEPNTRLNMISRYEPSTQLVARMRQANILKLLAQYHVPSKFVQSQLLLSTQSSIRFSLTKVNSQ